MSVYEIEVLPKKGFKDVHGEHVLSEIGGIGIGGVEEVSYSPLYRINGDLTFNEAEIIARELLIDKITEKSSVKTIEANCYPSVNSEPRTPHSNISVIEVWYKKGVTDTVADSVVKAVKDLGINKNITVKTGHKYRMSGKVSPKTLETAATKLLANTLIQEYFIK